MLVERQKRLNAVATGTTCMPKLLGVSSIVAAERHEQKNERASPAETHAAEAESETNLRFISKFVYCQLDRKS